MRTIRIVSEGNGIKTRVYTGDGEEIEGITGIDIRIRPGTEFNSAVLTFVGVEVDVIAETEEPPSEGEG